MVHDYIWSVINRRAAGACTKCHGSHWTNHVQEFEILQVDTQKTHKLSLPRFPFFVLFFEEQADQYCVQSITSASDMSCSCIGRLRLNQCLATNALQLSFDIPGEHSHRSVQSRCNSETVCFWFDTQSGKITPQWAQAPGEPNKGGLRIKVSHSVTRCAILGRLRGKTTMIKNGGLALVE